MILQSNNKIYYKSLTILVFVFFTISFIDIIYAQETYFQAPSRNNQDDSKGSDSGLAQRIINRFKSSRSCPKGMIYMRSASRPTPDCYCPGGEKQIFDLKNGSTTFGNCIGSSCSTSPDLILADKLSIWLDANDPTPSLGLPSNSGLLPRWEDKAASQGKADAFQEKLPRQPEFTLGAINERPAIKFSDSRHYIWGDNSTPTTLENFGIDSNSLMFKPYDIFIVFKSLSASNTQQVLFSGPNGKYQLILNRGFSGNAGIMYQCKGGKLAKDDSSLGTYTNSDIFIVNIRVDDTSENKLSMMINRNTANLTFNSTNECAQDSNNVNLAVDDIWALGNHDVSGNGPANRNFNGYIGEIIVTNDAISTQQRSNLMTYLEQKWQKIGFEDCFLPE